MDPEGLLNLFDSFWFEHQILQKQPFLSISPLSEQNPDLKIEESSSKSELSTFSSSSSMHTRSMSDQLSSNTSFDSPSSLSPNYSVLLTPKLQTIVSGKEIREERTGGNKHEEEEEEEEASRFVSKMLMKPERRRRKNKGESKSLSDLEFEELKGFMDLGYVFSEEDKESSLAEIIPGLQRLRKSTINGGEEEVSDDDHHLHEFSAIHRPYLSEAWEDLEKRRRKRRQENLLKSWKVPSHLNNGVVMKDSLKWWAHTVASTVR